MPAPAIEADVQALAEQLGRPLYRVADVEAATLFDPLSMSDRYGEVCMVIRRPDGRLLTAIKTFYPRGAYRLLTGGIQHGEQILPALLREVAEETGLEVEVRRFLAHVDYRGSGAPGAEAPLFSTFAFLLDEIGGTLGCADPDEQLEAFREIDIAELPALAAHLDNLPDQDAPEINGRWQDWGHFRAAIHRAVYEALSGSTS
jgi:8-oxo-dGTP pyrophosphatase MutT (NUDIX family)